MVQEHEQSRQSERSRCRGEAPATGAATSRGSEGDWGFWAAFAERHGPELSRCVTGAMARLGLRPDPSTVEELVQEVYCRLLEGRPPRGVAGWPAAQLWGYLHRIARTVVIDELRSRFARKRGGRRPREGCGAWPVELPLVEHRGRPATPEDWLLTRERAAALRRRVYELGGEHGPRNVRILELAAIEGCTAVEISRRLAGALTPSSVHTVIARLRRQLTATPPAAATGAG